MRRGPCRGMTLVELLVASAILVIVIAAVGYVYTQAARAVGVTQARIEINAKIRSVTRQLAEDLRAFSPDGMLLIAAPGPSAIPGANPPGVLMFTVTGRFESRTRRDASGRPVTANAALIVYVPARSTTGTAGPDAYILCRYVYLLTGDDQWPANLGELQADALANDPSDINTLDGSDLLGETLVDFRQRTTTSIRSDYAAPVLGGFQRVNAAPTAADDPVSGGIAQLWPYLIDGCTAMELEFCDGLAPDGVTPSMGPMEWFSPVSEAARRRTHLSGATLRRLFQGVGWMCWRPPLRDVYPIGLRIRLAVGDVKGRASGRTCELVLPVRR